jgi:hypothetical protein
MARYHVTVVSGDPSRTAAEAAAEAGAEVIRKMSVPEGVAALATDEQIDTLTSPATPCVGTPTWPCQVPELGRGT